MVGGHSRQRTGMGLGQQNQKHSLGFVMNGPGGVSD